VREKCSFRHVSASDGEAILPRPSVRWFSSSVEAVVDIEQHPESGHDNILDDPLRGDGRKAQTWWSGGTPRPCFVGIFWRFHRDALDDMTRRALRHCPAGSSPRHVVNAAPEQLFNMSIRPSRSVGAGTQAEIKVQESPCDSRKPRKTLHQGRKGMSNIDQPAVRKHDTITVQCICRRACRGFNRGTFRSRAQRGLLPV
jgi:hypothetical protein